MSSLPLSMQQPNRSSANATNAAYTSAANPLPPPLPAHASSSPIAATTAATTRTKKKRIHKPTPKSTVTQVSSSLLTSDLLRSSKAAAASIPSGLLATTNTYDCILAECETLLQAAMEAQQLGRLQLASTYLWLLHSRLVPIGKRLDVSHATKLQQLNNDEKQVTVEEQPADANSDSASVSMETGSAAGAAAATGSSPAATGHSALRQVESAAARAAVASPNDNHDTTAAAKQLGRGKKPETTPLYTAPSACCNVRELLERGQRERERVCAASKWLEQQQPTAAPAACDEPQPLNKKRRMNSKLPSRLTPTRLAPNTLQTQADLAMAQFKVDQEQKQMQHLHQQLVQNHQPLPTTTEVLYQQQQQQQQQLVQQAKTWPTTPMQQQQQQQQGIAWPTDSALAKALRDAEQARASLQQQLHGKMTTTEPLTSFQQQQQQQQQQQLTDEELNQQAQLTFAQQQLQPEGLLLYQTKPLEQQDYEGEYDSLSFPTASV
ncbi:hypothetical protein MPSEU_000180500 [Mayamaea pseudoterrestris]|nr:hypothetical protein MPSEU_000180500 [Mayamaea pseudoterrestris]